MAPGDGVELIKPSKMKHYILIKTLTVSHKNFPTSRPPDEDREPLSPY